MTIVARIAAVAAIALAATPVVAVGAAHAETQSRRIAVAGIDFSRADHVAKFERMISKAAVEICPTEARQDSWKMQACRSDLRRQAVAGLGDVQRGKLAQIDGARFAVAAK